MRLLPVFAALLVWWSFAFAQSQPARAPSLALKGHDPVSYFDPGRPARGTASLAYDFDDARYHFSSERNRSLFAANPDRYTPQFAGLCATGIGFGSKTEADPGVFLVRDGKLYVFSSVQAREMVEKDPSLLSKSHQGWKR